MELLYMQLLHDKLMGQKNLPNPADCKAGTGDDFMG